MSLQVLRAAVTSGFVNVQRQGGRHVAVPQRVLDQLRVLRDRVGVGRVGVPGAVGPELHANLITSTAA